MDGAWIDVGPAASLPEDGTLTVEVDGFAVVIVRCHDGLYAVEDRCTHDGEPLDGGAIEDCRIVCPRHGAQFCLRTGEALTPPAYEPVRTFRTREQDGRIQVEAPPP